MQFRRQALALTVALASGVAVSAMDSVGIMESTPWDRLRSFMATVLTNAGRDILTNRIIGSGTEPKNIGWGTGAGTAAATDTTLFTEKDVDLSATTGSRTAGTSSRVTTTVTNDTYQVTGTRTATGAGTVTNAGLFDNVTIGSGNLFLKGDFSGIALSSGDSIAFTIKLQFT